MSLFTHRVEAQPDLGPVAQLNRILPWLIGLAVLGLVLSRYLPQIHKNEEMRRQLQVKTEQVQKLEAEVTRLRTENNALLRDPRTIERTAREQLSYARPDERVVTFQDVPAPPTTVPRPSLLKPNSPAAQISPGSSGPKPQ